MFGDIKIYNFMKLPTFGKLNFTNMKKILTLCLIFITMLSQAQNVPILDRELFFGNPEIAGAQLSPDGQWIAFMKQYNGIMNVWVKKFDAKFEDAKPLTNSARPLMGYFWTEDGKYILYVKDENGDENINIFAVDPKASKDKDGVPLSRNLTPKKEVTAQINLVSKKDKDLLYIGLNDRDKAWHDLYSLKISTGEMKLMYENKDRVTGFDFDWDEKLRVMSKTDEKGNTVMYRVDEGNKLTEIYNYNVNESASISSWTADNKEAYLVTNKGDIDKSTLFLFNPQTKALKKVESDPNNKVDFGGLIMNDNTHLPIATSYMLDKVTYYWKDKTWEAMYKDIQKQLPGREISLSSSTQDYSKFLVTSFGDKYASAVYLYDVASKKLSFQFTPRPKLKEVEQYLAPMQSMSYKSSDGLEIPAYLTIPVGSSGKNLPVIMLIHGGPKGPRDTWGYDPEAQFLANRGYAVLQPNFRASGGYGKKFLNAGDKQWGKLMQDDITWGVKHLISKGIADKNKVAIMGGSYGGYATLAGLAFTPDLYNCGVDIVGPSNIFTLLESVPAYWESGRAFLHGMVGDPSTEEGKKLIREASPLFSADKINKPLLIIQGANDPRVKQAEADQIVVALREKGKDVSYILADDEGHGFRKPVNNMAMYAEVEKFLAAHLNGRFQQENPENIANRLREMKQDISKVTYTPAKEAKISKELPKIANQFVAGETLYDVKFEVSGQNLTMDMKRTIENIGENWKVRDEVKSQMGNQADEIVFGTNFNPISRIMEQGGQKIPMTIANQVATVEMGEQKMPITIDGALILDGPACDIIFAGMPLKENFNYTYTTVDMMTMKSKASTMSYLGEENIGDKKCWKVETIASDNAKEKTTYWLDPVTKSAIKMVSIIPSMGNAVMTVTRK
jgi:dipeptidyl aminopeptidase/acylaminoacyl peptidase